MLFKHSPTETEEAVIECLKAELVPFIQSSPGLGKSSIVRGIASKANYKLIDVRLSQCAPEDLMGLPMKIDTPNGVRSAFIPFTTFPIEGDSLPEGKDGWILFLDEFNSAPKSVQAAAYKLILDREVGQAKLHPKVKVVAAGNLNTDKAIVNSLSTAMQSRVIHVIMESNLKDWSDYAAKAGFDHRILAFLNFAPQNLHNFNPDHQDKTFACPRTWEFCSRLIKNKEADKINLKLVAGTIGEGVAVEFHAFLEEFANLPNYADIVKHPMNVEVPSRVSTKYAVVSMLAYSLKIEDFESVVQYVNRMTKEFQVIFYRQASGRQPKLQRNPSYVSATSKLLNEIM